MKPIVSIVIPAYNQASYVREAVESVLNQDYPDIELIVIDDGSTDNTRTILQTIDGCFSWETQPNRGQALALTRGWQIARGDILGYLSADDILMPTAVREAVCELANNMETAVVYCDFNLIDPHSRIIRRVVSPDFDYRSMLVEVTCPPGPGAFFRRSVYEKAGPWNPAYRQMPDYDFWLRMGLYGGFVRIPRILASFRVHESSLTYSQSTIERADEPVRIVEAILQHSSFPQELAKYGPYALARAYLVSAQLHLRAQRLVAAVAAIKKAWYYSPARVLAPKTAALLANAIGNRIGHRLLWHFRNLFSQNQGK
jgi:glycosyltransferase involved in cell wall biosynthesis